ncbi:MAG: NFACT RNA binding domain-containing protein [Clostridia bacterium]
MPMDALTLGFMARELSEALVGGRVDKVAQPERDEVLLTIRNHNRNCALLLTANANSARTHLTRIKKNNPLEPPMFCMLLRKHLVGGRIARVTQYGGDRILEIVFEHLSELGDPTVKTLVCEFMGKHSNLILTEEDGRIVDCARHVTGDISRVRQVLPGLYYERPPAHGKIPFDRMDAQALLAGLSERSGPLCGALASLISGLSRQTALEIALRATGRMDARCEEIDRQATCSRVQQLLGALPGLSAPTVVFSEGGAPLDVTAFPYLQYGALQAEPFPTLSEAMDAFYRERDNVERIGQKSASLRHVLRLNIERCEKKLALQQEALAGSARMEEYRLNGELLTAGQRQIVKGQKKALLINYYDPDCAKIEIALDEKLSPGQNAQRYFKLYQKARSAQTLAAKQIEKTREELDYLDGQLFNLANCTEETELNEIRTELEALDYVRTNHNRRQLKQLPPSRPMHFRSSTGSDILVGRNNVQNEKLTQSAQANEIWLHAKDMPGSHVIIVGEDPAEQAIYEAALLAARYSKGGKSSRVPVDYTLRKYVKKPAGGKPGFVTFTHQHTLYVTPSDEALAPIAQARD